MAAPRHLIKAAVKSKSIKVALETKNTKNRRKTSLGLIETSNDSTVICRDAYVP